MRLFTKFEILRFYREKIRWKKFETNKICVGFIEVCVSKSVALALKLS